MSEGKKYFEEFRRVSEHVLRKKLRPIAEEDEARERRSEDLGNDREDSSNDDYVFGNDAPIAPFRKRERQESQNNSRHENQVEEKKEVPLKRLKSKAVSQQGEREEKKPTKARYKKQDNVGNELVQESKINNLFKNLCQPSRRITVNSLGHTLQKYRIDFEVKDVVDMLKLHSSLTNPNKDFQDEQESEDPQSLDLKASINEEEFKELYRMIRKKQKGK